MTAAARARARGRTLKLTHARLLYGFPPLPPPLTYPAWLSCTVEKQKPGKGSQHPQLALAWPALGRGITGGGNLCCSRKVGEAQLGSFRCRRSEKWLMGELLAFQERTENPSNRIRPELLRSSMIALDQGPQAVPCVGGLQIWRRRQLSFSPDSAQQLIFQEVLIAWIFGGR